MGLSLLAVTSCAFTDINLVQDRRLAIVGLGNGDTVSVPFTVRWEVRKAIAPGHQVSYAVFVDTTAVKPGRSLKDVVPSQDRQCRADPACPDAAYLSRHGVYVVTQPRVTIPRVARDTQERELHRVTVVVLVDGRRDGEGAFSRNLYVRDNR
jgi:hypothetical protein